MMKITTHAKRRSRDLQIKHHIKFCFQLIIWTLLNTRDDSTTGKAMKTIMILVVIYNLCVVIRYRKDPKRETVINNLALDLSISWALQSSIDITSFEKHLESSSGHTPSVYPLVKYRFKIKGVSFWLHGFCGLWEGWDPIIRINHISWVVGVTPTDRPVGPQSLCNRNFGGVFVLSLCFLDLPVLVGAFVIGLSQISSFLSLDWIYPLLSETGGIMDPTNGNCCSTWLQQRHEYYILITPGCRQSVNVLNLLDLTSRRHRRHGSRK